MLPPMVAVPRADESTGVVVAGEVDVHLVPPVAGEIESEHVVPDLVEHVGAECCLLTPG